MNRSLLLSLLGLGLLFVAGCSQSEQESQPPAEQQEPATAEPPAPGSLGPDGLAGTEDDPESEVESSVRTTIDSKTGITLAYIPAGTFMMGSPASEEGRRDDETQHQVTLSKPFWMGTTEVTNAQYRRFVEATGHREPSYWDGSKFNAPNHPVAGVSWHDAVAYAKWAGMSLPTEAQWEYAARAGTTTTYWSGDSEADLARVGWYKGNLDSSLHAVGEKPANAWGLHDVHGHVREWTADRYGEYPGSSQTDPKGPGSGSGRVDRGGGWYYGASGTRVAGRLYYGPVGRYVGLGFRLSRTVP